ncbi:MAG TPA: hypothetical protein VGQ83_24510 [Polyangia bacterium]|jgi:hypothetical protein
MCKSRCPFPSAVLVGLVALLAPGRSGAAPADCVAVSEPRTDQSGTFVVVAACYPPGDFGLSGAQERALGDAARRAAGGCITPGEVLCQAALDVADAAAAVSAHVERALRDAARGADFPELFQQREEPALRRVAIGRCVSAIHAFARGAGVAERHLHLGLVVAPRPTAAPQAGRVSFRVYVDACPDRERAQVRHYPTEFAITHAPPPARLPLPPVPRCPVTPPAVAAAHEAARRAEEAEAAPPASQPRAGRATRRTRGPIAARP